MKSAYGWRVVQHGYVVTVEEAQELRDFVARTRAQQGKPLGLTDPLQVEQVLVLLGYATGLTATTAPVTTGGDGA